MGTANLGDAIPSPRVSYFKFSEFYVSFAVLHGIGLWTPLIALVKKEKNL